MRIFQLTKAPLTLVFCLSWMLVGRSAGEDIRTSDETGNETVHSFSDLIVRFAHSDAETFLESQRLLDESSVLRQVSMLQPTPFVQPSVTLRANVASTNPQASLASQLFDRGGLDRSNLRVNRIGTATFQTDLVRGEEALPVVSTDLGSLLGKSRTTLSVKTQKRTPIVTDSRVRSARIGSLAASGSYWVPARADLDTAMSKIDSRLIEDALVVPGPYSSLYGPGFNFVDFQLLRSPRYAESTEYHGRSSVDYQANGEQVFGQQSVWGGGETWGFRGNYTHRTGSDYLDGDENPVPSSYKSREFTISYGADLSPTRSIELSLLRLDQTDVEFPGYVFDIDYLVTDGYEITLVNSDPVVGDRIESEVWYNRTRFEGNAQNLAKRPQFPLLDRISYVGFTDVDSLSTGYRRARTWGRGDTPVRFSIGHDLRFIKQELNEISSGTSLGLPLPFSNRNSPIPESYSVNPGIFAEYNERFLCDYTFRTGGRIDFVGTDITASPGELAQVGLDFFPASYDQIVGTSLKQTDRMLFSLYGSLTRQFNRRFSTSISLGYAERAPTLTALYAAQPFLLLLQNGLNNVTGDPTLEKEKLLQTDLTMDFNGDRVRFGVRGYFAWAHDYLTFENTNVVTGPPSGQVQQVSLRYVNTELATLAGMESFVELFPRACISPFMSMQFVDGRDRTRNGSFATTNGSFFSPSTKVSGLTRGFFSGVSGTDNEPLPGISPFETRVGVLINDSHRDSNWNAIVSARIVDRQDRVAASLLETATPGFTVVDLRTTYRPREMPGLLLVAGAENLFDRTYQEHLDFRSPTGARVAQPGVNFYFGSDLSY